MIEGITIRGFELDARARAALARTFPGLPWAGPRSPAAPHRLEVDLDAWAAPGFDPLPLDWSLDPRAWDEPVELALVGRSAPPLRRVRQVITRFQRLLDWRNAASSTRRFARVLRIHRALHDLSLPLVRADYEHAIDTWRWVLRLEPEAGLALQIAALLHDVERLWSEPRRRVEHLAPDYEEFKRAHARGGARRVRELLGGLGFTPATTSEATRLVAEHERPPAEAGRAAALLRDADALSFFSLNAAGFLDHYGREHTERKVDYTLDRLSPSRRRLLLDLRHRADVLALVGERLPALQGSEAA